MTQNFTNKNFMSNLMNLAAILFIFVFGAVSCTEEDFNKGKNNGGNTVISGDTIISFNRFKLVEDDWSYSNGLAAANDHYFDGYVEYRVDEKLVKTDLIEHENAPMNISWTPIAETTCASAEKMYLGFKAEKAEAQDTLTNQKVNFIKYERECKLSFVGLELVLTGSWYEASLGNNSNVVACRYDSTSIATQVMDTVKVNGEKIVVEMEGKQYNRVVVTAKALNHFTDMPAKTTHKEQMDIVYSVLVPVNFVPGEIIYQGSASVEGTGIYTKVSDTEYKSQIDLTHYFIQDGKTSTEQETVSGTAIVRTWVEGDNEPRIWSSSNIGNPAISINESEPSELYLKEGNIYAKMYKTVCTYTWSDTNTGESFKKEIHSEVERLYYMRETGKAVAMPYGETTTSYKGFNAGAAVIKTQNGKEYEAYSGQISFNGNHKSTTGNVNDAIEGLVTSQEIWVEVVKEDEFLGYDKEIIAGNNDKDAQIIIVEHWSVSGDKTLTFTQSANYSFAVSEQQRVFGETLTFASGLSKSTNATKFNEVKEKQYVSTVTDTYTAKFNLCDVKATASYNKAYVEYRDEKIYFEFAATEVSYKGLNNPTATEVTVDGILYSRKAYEVSFAHSVLGTKSASVLVDEEIPMDPTIDPSWKIDVEKTKAYGRVSITWEKTTDGKFKPFYSASVICDKGIISAKTGYKQFTEMNTNNITKEVGNAWNGSKFYPAYITVDKSAANLSWSYNDVVSGTLLTDVHSTKMEVEGGFDKEKPFVGNSNDASIYQITDNGNTVRVIIVYEGQVLFNEVFAK